MSRVQKITTDANENFASRALEILAAVGIDNPEDFGDQSLYWIEDAENTPVAALLIIECCIAELVGSEDHKMLLVKALKQAGPSWSIVNVDVNDEELYDLYSNLGFELVYTDGWLEMRMQLLVPPQDWSLPEGVIMYTKETNPEDFSTVAVNTVNALYQEKFGRGVSVGDITTMQITRVLCIKDDTGAVEAATMVSQNLDGFYVRGIASRVKGRGRQLMSALVDACGALPIRLGVDKGTEWTDRLMAWYGSLGFETYQEKHDEVIMERGRFGRKRQQ